MDDTNLNLPFEVVVVPQHVVSTTTSYATPIKVKIKIKKGENNGTSRKGVISVPKLKPIYPEVTRRVRSDETIMSFNIRMEPENESRPPRKSQNKFFHIFKTGICLDTEDEDENDPPYMLASSDKANEKKPQRLLSDKKEKYSTKISKNKSKSPDNIFGKCKPGGCLDPPFGEDKYQYYRPAKLTQLEGKKEKNLQMVCTENVHNEIREKRIAEIGVKNIDNEESETSSTHMLYKVGSRNDILDDKYSDSIITYPTKTSSRDLGSLERSIISKRSSSLKTRQLNLDTYFTPTKLSKSQERKRESVNKRNTDTKDDVKEIIKIDVPSCNVPISKHTGDILLDDKVIQIDTLQTNPSQLKNQSNYKVSQLVEVSGNILLTVNHILEPTASFTSKPEEKTISEAKEVNSNYLDDHKNTTAILKSTTTDGSEEKPTFKKRSSSSAEIFGKLPKLNKTLLKTASTTISHEKQIFNENNAENGQIHYAIPKSDEQENQLSHVDSNENLSKLVSQENVVKQSSITYDSHETKTSELPQYTMKEVKSHKTKETSELPQYTMKEEKSQKTKETSELPQYIMKEEKSQKTKETLELPQYIMKEEKSQKTKETSELPQYIMKEEKSQKTKESLELPQYIMKEVNSQKTEETSELPQYIMKELKSQTHDLNLMTETKPNIEEKGDEIVFMDTIQTNEQVTKHKTDVLDNSGSNKVKNYNINIYEDLKSDSNKEFDKLKMSINSDNNKDHISEKMFLSNYHSPEQLKNSNSYSIPNNDTVNIGNDKQTTKETKSITNYFTANDKENMIKDNSFSKILLSHAAKTSPDVAVAKKNTNLSLDDTKQGSNDNLLQYNNIITENASNISNNISVNQFIEDEKSLRHGNILDNLPPKNETILIEDTLPAIFSTRKNMTTIPDTEIYPIDNTTEKNIKANDTNEILENDITVKQDSTKAGIKTDTDNGLPSKNSILEHTQYGLLDIPSTPVIAGDKSYDNIVSENVREPAKVTISYHGKTANGIYKTMPPQKTLSNNSLYDLEYRTTNVTKDDISNKSSSIKSTKYLEINNDLGIPYNTASNENLSNRSRKSFLDDNSIKPPLSTVISVNTITSNDAYLSSTTNITKKKEHGEIQHTPDTHYYSKRLDSMNNEKYDKNAEEWVPSNGGTKFNLKSAVKPAENNDTIIELGFQTYIDENGDTLLKTFDVHQEPQRFTQDSIFVTRKVLELSDSNLSFAINSDTRLSLKIDNNTKTLKERSFNEVSPSDTTQRIYRYNKMRYHASDLGTLQKSLFAVYENDLVPIGHLIKSLRLEIDRIIQYNQLLRKKSVTTIKKLRPTYSKRCVCFRKWNNID